MYTGHPLDTGLSVPGLLRSQGLHSGEEGTCGLDLSAWAIVEHRPDKGQGGEMATSPLWTAQSRGGGTARSELKSHPDFGAGALLQAGHLSHTYCNGRNERKSKPVRETEQPQRCKFPCRKSRAASAQQARRKAGKDIPAVALGTVIQDRWGMAATLAAASSGEAQDGPSYRCSQIEEVILVPAQPT